MDYLITLNFYKYGLNSLLSKYIKDLFHILDGTWIVGLFLSSLGGMLLVYASGDYVLAADVFQN
jgi:hypothetical protein